ncbi:MAG: MFS transporter [Chloroflexota bacterium]|nr:MFS transporter [Chloroflexota bacterium]MDE2885844.1 MFS transporter [Chloroflexota bacterium]
MTASQRPLAWVARDAWLMVSARFLRTFAQSLIAVFFGIYLIELGYSLVQMGLLITIGSIGSTVFATLIVFVGDTLGRRRLLIGFTAMMGLAGLGYSFTENYVLLAFVSFFVGSIAISGSGPRGPVQPLEQAALPDTTTAEHRTDLFALAGIGERAARLAGTLGAAAPAVLVPVLGVGEITAFKLMFVVYAVIMLASAAMYGLLSPAIDSGVSGGGWRNPLRLKSRRTIFSLAAIVSVDGFATRFVFFSLVGAWFHLEYGFDLAEVSYVLAGSTVLNMVSLWVAARLANRIGLLNTVIYTHIPAVAATLALPFAPTAWLAVVFWFVRAFFGQMDAPARQSYTMAIVSRDERVAMASITNVSQAGVGAVTPSLATVLWQAASASAPFVASGALKSVYLIGLYLAFKDVHPPEEQERAERRRLEREARRSGGAGG